MVCSKCAKLTKPTSLATPHVKSKKEMYYGSPAGSKTTNSTGYGSVKSSSSSSKTSATLGQNGIGKSKLLSAGAKNPYAAYNSTCTGEECAAKIESGRKFCNRCAYRKNVCAICGKKEKAAKTSVPAVAGQKFTMK